MTVSLKDGRLLIVRPLRADDTDALTEFYASVPPEDYRFYRAQPLTPELAAAQTARVDGHFVCLVGEDAGGKIVGYAWYEWKDAESESSHFGICIRRGWQECGTGYAIASRLLERARRIGPPRMHLTVQVANARAVALYKKLGFVVVAEQERAANAYFPAEPDYRMEQALR